MMKPRINREFLTQTSFDSAAPRGLACVITPLPSAGQFEISLLDEKKIELERVGLTVLDPDECEELPTRDVLVDFDGLRRQRRSRAAGAELQASIAQRGGFLKIASTGREERYSVRVNSVRDKAEVFNSENLGDGDIFAVTLVRPGDYELRNVNNNDCTRVTVAYPVVGKRPYRPPPPLVVSYDGCGFEDELTLKPAQGLVVKLTAGARLDLRLTQADDGPDKGAAQRGANREQRHELLKRLRDEAARRQGQKPQRDGESLRRLFKLRKPPRAK